MQPKIFPFPVISPASLDYQSTAQYNCKISRMSPNNIMVNHNIADNNIIADLLKKGIAKFGCMVSLPATMYRQVFIDDSKLLNVDQKVNYNKSGAHSDVQHPMFRPVIIMTEEFHIPKSDEKYGFNDIWLGQEIKFPQGAIVGFDDWMKFGNAVSSILLLKVDENIKKGMIKVQADALGGFRFNVLVHQSLFDFIVNPHEEKNHARSILTHALSRGLEILATDDEYKKNWEQYPNLKLLGQHLEAADQPHWNDHDFHPEQVATSLYQHTPSTDRSDNEN